MAGADVRVRSPCISFPRGHFATVCLCLCLDGPERLEPCWPPCQNTNTVGRPHRSKFRGSPPNLPSQTTYHFALTLGRMSAALSTSTSAVWCFASGNPPTSAKFPTSTWRRGSHMVTDTFHHEFASGGILRASINALQSCSTTNPDTIIEHHHAQLKGSRGPLFAISRAYSSSVSVGN